MDEQTVDLYDRRAGDYRRQRRRRGPEEASAWAERVRGPDSLVLDAGCGPGLDLPGFPDPVVGLDAAFGMLRWARRARPSALTVQADLAALPFRARGLAGCWARQSYLHLRRVELPLALADLHRALGAGAPARLQLLSFGGDGDGDRDGDGIEPPRDDFPGRFFASWSEESIRRVVEGAGFEIEEMSVGPAPGEAHKVRVDATRARTLPDYVSAGMRVLFCGLNPSLHAADAGYGYAGPGNRFWPAVGDVGLTGHGRDPWLALRCDGVGMTDLVKRATPRAAELATEEYREGASRVGALVEWLRPSAVCFVGLGGYRAAVDRRAVAGWQSDGFGGAPAYVMPSTSGLNTHASAETLVTHLREVERATR